MDRGENKKDKVERWERVREWIWSWFIPAAICQWAYTHSQAVEHTHTHLHIKPQFLDSYITCGCVVPECKHTHTKWASLIIHHLIKFPLVLWPPIRFNSRGENRPLKLNPVPDALQGLECLQSLTCNYISIGDASLSPFHCPYWAVWKNMAAKAFRVF